MTLKEFCRKIFSPYLIGNCLGMVVLGGLFVFGTIYFIDWYTNHGVEAKVPNLVGKNVNVGIDQCDALGLEVEVADTGYIRTLPPDIILQQSTPAGDVVKPGRIIYVTINAAHALAIALPDVADNSSYRDAVAQLEALGFKCTAPKYTAGDRNWVYGIQAGGKDCKAGDRVSVDTPITLIVGDGKVYEGYNGNDSLDHALNGDMNALSDDDIEDNAE